MIAHDRGGCLQDAPRAEIDDLQGGTKLGEMKIKELRKRAEQALGTSFNVREFHNVVLGSGAVPLSVLEANVEAWLRRAQDQRVLRN